MHTPKEVVNFLKDKGWNASQIARESGVSQPIISKLLKTNNNIRFDTFAKLQALLDEPVPIKARKARAKSVKPVVRYKAALENIIDASSLDEAIKIAQEAIE